MCVQTTLFLLFLKQHRLSHRSN